jgi:hypothetical protein
MSSIADYCVRWAERNESRRGFLALCGKSVLALGAAVYGFASIPLRVDAVCCTSANPVCDSIPPHTAACPTTYPGGCPTGCTDLGRTTCCDAGSEHICSECLCSVGYCHCEVDSLVPC